MLAADHRLRHSDSFRRTVRSGRRAGAAAMVVHLRVDPSDGAAPPRVGFVVGKTVGGAVVRNRVRRRLRHLTREHLGQLPPGSELVLRALPASAELGSKELGDQLTRCLDRVLRARTGAPE